MTHPTARTPRIVAFFGYAGSGKSTAASVLVDAGYRHTPFADTLKTMLLLMGLTQEQVYGSLKEEPCDLLCGKTPRFAMQTLGTEWGRELIGDDVWVNAWAHSVEGYGRVVVDDLRFPNEHAMLRSLDARIIRVVRRSVMPGTHESERHVGSMTSDAVVQNDGSLEDLEAEVRRVLEGGWL